MDGALEASGALGAYFEEKAFETIGTGRTDGTLGTLGPQRQFLLLKIIGRN